MERELLEFVDELGAAHEIGTAVRVVTAGVARMLDVGHASLRLLDDSRTRLLLASRTGRSPYAGTDASFTVGEGLVGWVIAHRRALRVGCASEDPRFAARPGRNTLMSFLAAPLSDDRGCFGVLAATSPARDAFSEDDEVRLRLIAALAAGPLEVHRLRRLAETDSLTGLLNRHALERVLPATGAGDAVVMLDVDHFKDVNDRHGHAAGDRALADLADAVRASVRLEDHVVRYGGEEILVVLPSSTAPAALETAERVRACIAASVRVEGEPIAVSAGVTVRRPGESRESLLARVDEALYAAKRAGRDRAIVA